MAAEFELLGTEKAGAVVGTTTHTGLDRSLYGQLKQTDYVRCTTVGSTYILSTAAYIDRLVVTPISTGAGAVTLADGTTAIFSIPPLPMRLILTRTTCTLASGTPQPLASS